MGAQDGAYLHYRYDCAHDQPKMAFLVSSLLWIEALDKLSTEGNLSALLYGSGNSEVRFLQIFIMVLSSYICVNILSYEDC